MYYIYIKDSAAHESIPDENPIFPGIPIEDRYAPDFLAQCVQHDEPVPCGYLYDPETGEFTEPPPPPEPEPLPELSATDPPAVEPDVLAALTERLDELESAQDAMMDGLA